MAKKKTAKKTTGKAQKKGPAAPKKGQNQQGIPLEAEQHAAMWILRQEGRSLREIAAEVGVSPRTVAREFERDPARHAALVRSLAEDRAAKWRQSEHRSIGLLVKILDEIHNSLWTPTGRPRNLSTKAAEGILLRLEVLRKLVGPIRMAADSSTKMSQLLTGKPTEIINGTTTTLGVDPSQMTGEEAIRLAHELDLIEDLPVALREKHAKMLAAGQLD